MEKGGQQLIVARWASNTEQKTVEPCSAGGALGGLLAAPGRLGSSGHAPTPSRRQTGPPPLPTSMACVSTLPLLSLLVMA